jgi:AraC-like DNA-binding protein
VRDPIPVYVHLLRAKDMIDREYARELDVATLARQAHASTAHFARSFTQAFGETPHQYLRRRRIERAAELLRGTGVSVSETSLEVGFHSLGSFSSAFRELVGESPAAYARRWRDANAPAIPACFTLMYTRPTGAPEPSRTQSEQSSRSAATRPEVASPRSTRKEAEPR